MDVYDTLLRLLMVASIPTLVIIASLIMGYGSLEHAVVTGSLRNRESAEKERKR